MLILGIVVAALVLLLVGGWLWRVLIAAMLGDDIGRQSLAQQPVTIHLEPCGDASWRDAAGIRALVEPWVREGFRDVGGYAVPEMPGVRLRLLVHEADAWLGAVYEHPKVAPWLDLATYFADGTSVTIATSPDHGLDPQPGHAIIRLASPDAVRVLARAREERAQQPSPPIPVGDPIARFENALNDYFAWRRTHGIRRHEVVNVAVRKAG